MRDRGNEGTGRRVSSRGRARARERKRERDVQSRPIEGCRGRGDGYRRERSCNEARDREREKDREGRRGVGARGDENEETKVGMDRTGRGRRMAGNRWPKG